MAENLIRQIERTIDAIDLDPGEKAIRVAHQLIDFLELDPDMSQELRTQLGRTLRAGKRELGLRIKREIDDYQSTRGTNERS
jgi:hypothetical protein